MSFRKEFREFMEREWTAFRSKALSHSAVGGVNGATGAVGIPPPQA